MNDDPPKPAPPPHPWWFYFVTVLPSPCGWLVYSVARAFIPRSSPASYIGREFSAATYGGVAIFLASFGAALLLSRINVRAARFHQWAMVGCLWIGLTVINLILAFVGCSSFQS